MYSFKLKALFLLLIVFFCLNTAWGEDSNPPINRYVPENYPTIQTAIDTASPGDVVVVAPGVYYEKINFSGKNITVRSEDPADPSIVENTVIDARGNGSVVTFASGEGPEAVLSGFTITGGSTSGRGGGISGNGTHASILNCRIQNNDAAYGGGIDRCHGRIEKCIITNNSASINGGGFCVCGGVIANCLVYNNSAANWGGGLHYCNGSISNCTIVDNMVSVKGGGLSSCSGIITNSIVWANSINDLFDCSLSTYCCYSGATGEGNIDTDPLFVNPTAGDYHLSQDSPCINGGDPAYETQGNEIDIDGQDRILSGGIDIGADEFEGYFPPQVYAGPDQSFMEIPEIVTLQGILNASYYPEVTFQWQQISGPEVSLENSDTLTPTFMPMESGVYVFELIASEEFSQSHPDQVGVVVGDHSPIADAGLTVYATTGLANLDGSGSYDRDGYGELTYTWKQISGNTLSITDTHAIKPQVFGFTQTNSVQKYNFELVVSDGILCSRPDVVTLVIIPTFEEGVLYQVNPPFDPSKPTIIAFAGGNCSEGGGQTPYVTHKDSVDKAFRDKVNWLTVTSYEPPYISYGDMVIDYLYRMAPNYDQLIQTTGHSTGNMPAIDIAIYINTTFADPRYAVNRITFQDAACRYYSQDINEFLASRVDDEQCWIDNYYSTAGRYYPGAITVRFPVPPANHGTPTFWYFNSILFPKKWKKDVYNGGVVAGTYLSVFGEAKNLDIVDPFPYYFELIGLYDPGSPDGEPGYIEFYDENTYPGKLLQPVTLEGCVNGAVVGAEGAFLSCLKSTNAIRYQLLFGASPNKMDYLISETDIPPSKMVTQFPFEKTYWTIKAFDQYGNSIYADPICIQPETVHEPVENVDLGKRYPYIQLAIDEAEDGEEIVVDPGVCLENINFKGKNLILRSLDPTNATIVAKTVLQGTGNGSVVTFSGTEDATCVLSGFTITDGSTSERGGGILGNDTYASILNCRIQNNNAAYGGGFADCSGNIENCIIANNLVTENGGGLINCHGAIKNCLIYSNSSSRGGGMDYCNGSISNCTIADNVASVEGGGLNNCSGIIANCIVWGNSIDNLFGCSLPTYCCYSDAAGEGNIDTDPLFVNPVNGDYYLSPNSPCIDTGDPAYVLQENEMDINGWFRIIGHRVDIGAFEYDGQHACISLTPKTIEFYVSEDTSFMDSSQFQIVNIGASPLNWEINEDCPWLTISPSNGDLTEDIDETLVSVDANGLLEGVYKCTADISSDNAVNNHQPLEVILHVNHTILHVPSEYKTIQRAIKVSQDSETVVVSPGTYNENFNFRGKNITLTSIDPTNPDVVKSTIIQGLGNGSVITFSGTENETCMLKGFTITGGATSGRGGGISGNDTHASISNCRIQDNFAAYGGGIDRCHGRIEKCIITNNSASANGGGFAVCGGVIANCLVYHNSAANLGGGLHYCNDSISNCTIVDNMASVEGGGLSSCGGAITNSIISGNLSDDLRECSLPTYSCYPNAEGQGCFSNDPMFNDPNNGDYCLLADSPCINAGDPNYIPDPNETDLDGNPRVFDSVVDIGCYEFVPPIEVEAILTPQSLNRESNQMYVIGRLELAGFSEADINPNEPMVLMQRDIAAERVEVLPGKQGNDSITLVGFFDHAALIEAIDNLLPATQDSPLAGGELEITLTAKLLSGQRVYGRDIVKVK